MEDSLGTLIYILIAVVGLIISALSKKKKKGLHFPQSQEHEIEQDYNEQEKESIFTNLENLLNDELRISNTSYNNSYDNKDRTQEIKYEVEEAPGLVNNNTQDNPGILDRVPPEMLDKELGTPYSIEYEDMNQIFTDSIQDTEIKSEENERNAHEEFDLEKAIIYSEIINKKEY